MTEEVNFDSLNLPIPDIVKTYSNEKKREIFEYLNENCVLEAEPLARLASDEQLAAYRHEGFWQPMDTLRESNFLNELWNLNEAPWKNW